MKLIVGLGNPGFIYSGSRHNIGFQAVKYLAKSKNLALKKEKGISALSGKVKVKGVDTVLALPLTFMNLSGEAVRPLLKKYGQDLSDLLVVCDDLDLEFGRLRLCSKGSSAGHRGIQSIIEHLGSNEFSRVRVGIGSPWRLLPGSKGCGPKDDTTRDYVLSRFNRREISGLAAIIEKASDCCVSWVSEGVEKSMNAFNRRNDK
ncbi:MAG: aminoacyl-tRNA hydrolase [Candidatus Omnitrophota bacterium]